MRVREKDGKVKSYLIEVRAKRQVEGPKRQNKKTKTYITEVKTYATNRAKWDAAEQFCKDRLWSSDSSQNENQGLMHLLQT